MKFLILILLNFLKISPLVFAVDDDEIQYTNFYLNDSHVTFTESINIFFVYPQALKFCKTDETTKLLFANGLTDGKRNLSDVFIYDSQNISKNGFIGNLGDINTIITSHSGCFIVHRPVKNATNVSIKIFVTILPSMFSKNGMFSNLENKILVKFENCNGPNVFFKPTTLNISATDNVGCDIIILSDIYNPFEMSSTWDSKIRIKNFKTNAKSITLKSAQNDKELLNINNSDMQIWKNMCIYTTALFITVPPSTYSEVNFEPISGIQSGIMASSSYSGISQPLSVYSEIYYFNSENSIAILLNIKELTGKINITHNDISFSPHSYQTYYFVTTDFVLNYNPFLKNDSFFIEYSLSQDFTTSTTSTTMAKKESKNDTSVTKENTDNPNSNIYNVTITTPAKGSQSSPLIYIIIGSIAILCLLIILGILFGRRIYFKRKRMQFLNSILNTFVDNEKTIKEFCKDEIDPKNLLIDYTNTLGSGSTSSVFQGLLKNSLNCKVAVKIATNTSPNDTTLFATEFQILSSLPKHANILTFFGWSMIDKTLAIITEIAKTDLLYHLRAHEPKNLATKNFIKISMQISAALEHLTSHGIIHRDVACRNILLFENFVVKLSDFGLCCYANNTEKYIESNVKRFPFRWLSPEVLKDQEFSEKSDVWAFGILCYEMFTYGKIPYESLTNEELLEFLEAQNRLEKPENCPDILYDLMLDCWMFLPQERPNFAEIYKCLKKLIKLETMNYGYLDLEKDVE